MYQSFEWEPFALFTSPSFSQYTSFLVSSSAFASTRAPGVKFGKSLVTNFWSQLFHWYIVYIIYPVQSKPTQSVTQSVTQSCVFVIPWPTASYESTALGRRLVTFFLSFFSKVGKVPPQFPASSNESGSGPWSHMKHTWCLSPCSQTLGCHHLLGMRPAGLRLQFHSLLGVSSPLRYFSCFWRASFVFWFSPLYFTCHLYVFGAKGVSQNVHLMCHLDWKIYVIP